MLRNLISSHHHQSLVAYAAAVVVPCCRSCSGENVFLFLLTKIKMHSLILWFIYCDISVVVVRMPTEFRRGWCQGFCSALRFCHFCFRFRSFVFSRNTIPARMYLKGAIWVCAIINQACEATGGRAGGRIYSYPASWRSNYCWKVLFT